MRSLAIVTTFLALLVPVTTWALTPPLATYDVSARVISAIDDEVEGIRYVRVRLTVLESVPTQIATGAPTLGTGTTLSAIVRDTAVGSVLKSVNASTAVPLTLGWFDANTYEVTAYRGSLPTAASTTQATGWPPLAMAASGALILFLFVVAFRILRR